MTARGNDAGRGTGMKAVLGLASTLCLLAGGAHAQADHFANIELDAVATQAQCMSQARQALEILAASGGDDNRDISQGEWSTFGWNIPPLIADISVVCPVFGGQAHPFATAHTTGDGNEPGDLIEAYAEIFNKF